MILKRLFYLLLISGTFFYSGCYYDVEEVLYPSGECNTDSVTYSLVVLPILEQQCYGCHTGPSLSGNVNLELKKTVREVEILVYNGLGQVAYRLSDLEQPGALHTLLLGNQPKGVYVVEVRTDAGIGRQKVVIE